MNENDASSLRDALILINRIRLAHQAEQMSQAKKPPTSCRRRTFTLDEPQSQGCLHAGRGGPELRWRSATRFTDVQRMAHAQTRAAKLAEQCGKPVLKRYTLRHCAGLRYRQHLPILP